MRLDAIEPAADFLSAILPGTFTTQPGTYADYRALAHFHYAPGHPVTQAGIWKIVYRDDARARLVAVGVLSYPTPACKQRERALGLGGPRYGPKLLFVNAHVRTISRVIVHPQFRALGIASALVRRVCRDCPTRYVEAIAAMGEVHPFFERAGMRRMGERYFIFDRQTEKSLSTNQHESSRIKE